VIPLAAVLYFAMSLPAGASLQWWGPLTRSECQRIERVTSGTWCHQVRVRR
jgi:hypothetical protein